MRLSNSPSPNPPANHGMPPPLLPQQQPAAARPNSQGSITWSGSPATHQQRPSDLPSAGAQRRDNTQGGAGSLAQTLIGWLMPKQGNAVNEKCGQPPAANCQPTAPSGEGEQQMPFEEVISILGRHEGLLKDPQDREGLEKLRDDDKTPSDAKQALSALLDNKAYFAAFDGAKEGKTDGKISSKDVQKLQERPEMRVYADFKAAQFTDNYVPSDAPPNSPARAMTANDAMRELFRYSESLPKNISLETLQNIADGSEKMDKCPPQLAAAAKFFVQNPDQWQAFSGKDNPTHSVSRDRLCDLASFNVKLSPQERKALDTLDANRDIFFKGGGIKTDKLESIANNKENSKEVRDAANLLAQPNSMLFSMLDNAKHGAGGNFFNKANDRNISTGDLDAFLRKGSNQVAEPPRASMRPVESAQRAMVQGQESQPDPKKEKGGGFTKLLEALSYLTMFIPGIGMAGAAAAAGRMIGTVVGRSVATSATREAVTQAGTQTTRQALSESARQGGREGLKDGVRDAGIDMAKDLGKEGLNRYRDRNEEPAPGNPNLEQPRVWAQS